MNEIPDCPVELHLSTPCEKTKELELVMYEFEADGARFWFSLCGRLLFQVPYAALRWLGPFGRIELFGVHLKESGK